MGHQRTVRGAAIAVRFKHGSAATSEDFDGEVRPRTRPASQQDDGLYRYVPVPPAGYDDDGYLVEDDKPQPSVDHQRQTAHWREALALHLPAATVCSNLTVHYREGDRGAAIVPDLFVALEVPPQEDAEPTRRSASWHTFDRALRARSPRRCLP